MTDKKTDKKNDKRDRELGMSCPITRRDFLNGVALGLGGILAAPHFMASSDSNVFAPEKAPEYYPPALMGMRGNHDGTFTFAHSRAARSIAPSPPIAITRSDPAISGLTSLASQWIRSQ